MTRPLAVRGVVGGFAASMDINGEQFRRDGEQVTLQVTLDPNNEKYFILKSGPYGASAFLRKACYPLSPTATPPFQKEGAMALRRAALETQM